MFLVKGREGVSSHSFSFRERKPPAVSFLKYGECVNFPPELPFEIYGGAVRVGQDVSARYA